jgi:hypothetical protein
MNQTLKDKIKRAGLVFAFLSLNPISLNEIGHRLRYELLETKPTNSYWSDGALHTISRDRINNSLYIQRVLESKRFYDTDNDGKLDSLVINFPFGQRVAVVGEKRYTYREKPGLFEEANQLYQKYEDRFKQ